jgi:Rrf2 family iron-sulfur cluster assembly transcriptional regulator
MFPLSLSTGYAVLALNCMNSADGDPTQVASVAAATGLPGPFLSKIVNRLAAEGLVKTRRGRSGGIALARPADQITLEEIVRAVEGEDWDKGCFLGLRKCGVPDGHCPFHDFWLEGIERFRAKMASVTLADLECFNPAKPCGDTPRGPEAFGITQIKTDSDRDGCPHNCSPGTKPCQEPTSAGPARARGRGRG